MTKEDLVWAMIYVGAIGRGEPVAAAVDLADRAVASLPKFCAGCGKLIAGARCEVIGTDFGMRQYHPDCLRRHSGGGP